jgi:prophage regulatory protein
MNDKIVRLPAVKEKTGLSRSTIYLKVAAGEFPRPVSLGLRAIGWVESDIDSWLKKLARGTATQRATNKRSTK